MGRHGPRVRILLARTLSARGRAAAGSYFSLSHLTQFFQASRPWNGFGLPSGHVSGGAARSPELQCRQSSRRAGPRTRGRGMAAGRLLALHHSPPAAMRVSGLRLCWQVHRSLPGASVCMCVCVCVWVGGWVGSVGIAPRALHCTGSLPDSDFLCWSTRMHVVTASLSASPCRKGSTKQHQRQHFESATCSTGPAGARLVASWSFWDCNFRWGGELGWGSKYFF